MIKKVYDVCLAKKNSKGEYIKNSNGKSIYKNVGSVLKDDEGYYKLVIETLAGEIWLSLFPVKENMSNDNSQKKEVQTDLLDDNLPF